MHPIVRKMRKLGPFWDRQVKGVKMVFRGSHLGFPQPCIYFLRDYWVSGGKAPWKEEGR